MPQQHFKFLFVAIPWWIRQAYRPTRKCWIQPAYTSQSCAAQYSNIPVEPFNVLHYKRVQFCTTTSCEKVSLTWPKRYNLTLKEILSFPVPVTFINIFGMLLTTKILGERMKNCFKTLPPPACIADVFQMNWIKHMTFSKGTIPICLGP